MRQPALESLLHDEPFTFGFFQAVRLLQLLSKDREPVGGFHPPSREALRFGANPSLSFPASEVHAIELPDGEPVEMTVNFMGLTGPLGVLPLYYTEMVRDRARARDRALRDFLDIFNHRIISLFYQAWEKYRFPIGYEAGQDARLSQYLLSLIGLGTARLQRRQQAPDEALIYYGGLLSLHTRSALALEQLLGDFFGVPVEVEQFVGAWHALDRQTQCGFRESGTPSEQLGIGAVAGDEVWDTQSGARIRLGPLTLEQYLDFLPGGGAHGSLRALVAFFSNEEWDFEVQLVLRRMEVPACELDPEEGEAPRLGWTSWIKSAPFRRDPDDTIFRI